ncbi:hypothetical protein [Paenibacillus eucommiae]|uniref:Uncharacterized protein n=1 Tax=Paenibacillus eucommiae TaxID=1355755 RepID=A0ABS4ISQ2_9BACL|nr:hypothetical protein [Paenibacillus eucommiae]MBP1990588.1 hypothetical protein [Paenibacillus eucommiae]
MALNSKIKVGIPQSGIILVKAGHTSTKTYRNSNGQPTSDRICIGKLDPASWFHFNVRLHGVKGYPSADEISRLNK